MQRVGESWNQHTFSKYMLLEMFLLQHGCTARAAAMIRAAQPTRSGV